MPSRKTVDSSENASQTLGNHVLNESVDEPDDKTSSVLDPELRSVLQYDVFDARFDPNNPPKENLGSVRDDAVPQTEHLARSTGAEGNIGDAGAPGGETTTALNV